MEDPWTMPHQKSLLALIRHEPAPHIIRLSLKTHRFAITTI